MLIPRTRTQHIVYGGVAATLLIGVVLVWMPDSRRISEPMQPIGAATLERTPSAATVSPLGVAASDQGVTHVELLGRELKTVTAKMGQLEAQLALLSRGNDSGTPPREVSSRSTTREIPLGQASPEQTTPLERFRHFQTVMQTEREDPRATATLQAAFRNAAENLETLPGSSVTDISCRETMCKVSASHNGQEALDQFLRSIPAAVPWDMTAEIQYEPLANGSSQTVVFVSMKDKALPEK